MELVIENINKITDVIGKPATAILILIIGFIIAKIIKKGVKKLINKVGFDKLLKSNKVNIAELISKLIYFFVLIFVFMLALEKLEMTNVLEPVKALLNEFLSYIPNIIGAGLVGYIGYMLAKIVSELVGISGETIQKIAPKLNLPENINLVSILKKIVFIFIFVTLAIQALAILNFDAISQPATDMLQTFFEAIPKVLVASIIMIVFIVGGKFLSNILKDLLDSLKLDEFLGKDTLKSLIGKSSIEKLIANIVYVFIILFGLITAVDKLEFSKLSEILDTIVYLAGNILFGLVILAVGNWLANIAAKNFAKGENNTFITNIIKIAIITIFLAIGLRKMGIADDIINLAFGITLGAVALTVVLSFGLGGREAAGKQMEKILKKFNKEK